MGKVIKSKHGYTEICVGLHDIGIEQDIEDGNTVLIMFTDKEAVELANYILDNVNVCRHCGNKLPCYCKRDEK